MKMNQLFPKLKMNELFNKYGFERQGSTESIVYTNQYISSVIIGRHRFMKGIFLLDCNALSVYNIKIEGFKREWKDEESQNCINFIENTLLPQIQYLKGPFNIDSDYYFKRVEVLFSKHVNNNGKRGNKNFLMPFRDIEREENYDYLQFYIGEIKSLFFLNKAKIYLIYILENTNKKIYAWQDFVDREKEGDELIEQMVENIAKFLKIGN